MQRRLATATALPPPPASPTRDSSAHLRIPLPFRVHPPHEHVAEPYLTLLPARCPCTQSPMPSTQLISSSLEAASLARQLAPLLLLPPRYHRAALDAMPSGVRLLVEVTPREALPPTLKQLLLPWGQAGQPSLPGGGAGSPGSIRSTAAGPETPPAEAPTGSGSGADRSLATARQPRPPSGPVRQALAPEILIVTAAGSLLLTRLRTAAALGCAAAATAVMAVADVAT
eukprot:scaffold14824_cov83-Isochrysis_galbana.AAC.4